MTVPSTHKVAFLVVSKESSEFFKTVLLTRCRDTRMEHTISKQRQSPFPKSVHAIYWSACQSQESAAQIFISQQVIWARHVTSSVTKVLDEW
jgi:hypothetical protein